MEKLSFKEFAIYHCQQEVQEYEEDSKPLNSSSRSMLVNKKLHEDRKTKFCFKALGSEEIPEWIAAMTVTVTAEWNPTSVRLRIADANCILKGCTAFYHNSIHSC
ncbi:hypothetical protein P8452_55871 [Trifolium repens]|nr:hypothetical protein P8452_55871 [Trifolium repens]